MALSKGFPPVADSDATVLILGSLPSRRSIAAFEYYAHPRNVFWLIMGELFGAGRQLPYAERLDVLKENNIALWDVLAASVRPGSMDSDIDPGTAEPNDFAAFLDAHRSIRMICFNGQKAAGFFDDLVLPDCRDRLSELRLETLPSTSPAFASMPYDEKLRQWTIVLQSAVNR